MMAYRLKGFILGLILFGPLMMVLANITAGLSAVSTGEIDGRVLRTGLSQQAVEPAPQSRPYRASIPLAGDTQ